METLISVIIPVYNTEAYLSRCLDSVLASTFRNLEVVCVDDGSTDSSAEILRAYAAKDSRVVPIFRENGGVSSARNAGMAQMKGEYFTFVDSDDYVHPQYVELLYRALRESGTEIAVCGFQRVAGNASVRMEQITYDPKDLQVMSFSRVFAENAWKSHCCRKMYSAHTASATRFRENLQYLEDGVFFSEVCEKAKIAEAACLPYPLYFYCRRASSLSRGFNPLQFSLALGVFVDKLLRPDRREDIYLDQTIKRGLNLRYLSSHIMPDPVIAEETEARLAELRKMLYRTKECGTGKKIVYLLMIRFPGLYWLYRVVKDPAWLRREMTEKKRRRRKTEAGS